MVDVDKWRARVNSMLAQRPVGTDEYTTKLWDQTADTTIDLIEKWTDKELDDGKSEFASWNDGVYQYEGMRHRISKKPHGICRRMHKTDGIKEGLWKEGRKEGLHKEWYNDGDQSYFYLELYKNGGRLSYYYVRDDWSPYHQSGDISYHEQFESMVYGMKK